jgi:hypothetical protein
MMAMPRYEVIVNTSVADRPKDHEMKAALIVANSHFRADVVFLRPEIYKTPDLEINSVKWELKSPLGQGKKTIENNMRAARRQSVNLIIDFARIKLHQTKALANIRYYIQKYPGQFRRIIVITKGGEVIEILG